MALTSAANAPIDQSGSAAALIGNGTAVCAAGGTKRHATTKMSIMSPIDRLMNRVSELPRRSPTQCRAVKAATMSTAPERVNCATAG